MTTPCQRALTLIAAAAALNYIVLATFLLGTIPFNVVRVLLSVWAGWLLVSKVGVGLSGAALAGALVMVVDQIILNGGYFLLAQLFWPESVNGQGLLAFGGVLISFVMFAPIAALLGLLGGFLARRKARPRHG